MPSTYQTPGVYIEEVSTFPASVAPVETAIPAFIGYTEKAIKNGESLSMIPTKVGSFVEFVQYFGGAPDRGVIIRLNAQNQFVTTEMKTGIRQYYLYDSLRLFYDNGGGDCYIVSVDTYSPNGVDIGDAAAGTGILGGLKALEKYDEPTLIVSPDATLLGGDGMYTYQQQALKQCAKLQDRFLIGDLLQNSETTPNETFDDRVAQVRDKIGINDLKYGALYAPWLRTSLSANLQFRDVLFTDETTALASVTQDSSRGLLFGMTADENIRNIILDLEEATSTAKSLEQLIAPSSSLLGTSNSLAAALKKLNDDFLTAFANFTDGSDDWTHNSGTNLSLLYQKMIAIFDAIQTIYNSLSSSGATGNLNLKNDIQIFNNNLKTTFDTLLSHYKAINDIHATVHLIDLMSNNFINAYNLFYPTNATPGIADVNTTALPAYTGSSIIDQITLAHQEAHSSISKVTGFFNDVLNAAQSYESTFNASLKSVFGTYKTLLSRAEQDIMTLPPSAAIAGIYTKVDNERGVWKAPANVSLSSVSAPYVVLNSNDQESLNVDVNAGKSINAIRAFTGKGILVWGARTLAGNDNEWRYVPVRRFFNFAEESIKKATEAFVFEPNDANTWVRVRAMIENFLTLQWRAGALAGAKPNHAFFVKIGLGETMTAIDILEGRMIVEIGMAVVRPAEFIILRFSHKMQES